MRIRHMRIEDASGECRKALADVLTRLEGADTGVAGTVGVNVLIQVALAECDSMEAIDAFVEGIADAMRAGCRSQLERWRAAQRTMQ